MHDVEPHVNHFMRIGEEQKHAHHEQTNFKQGNIVERRVQVTLKSKALLLSSKETYKDKLGFDCEI